MIGRLLKRGKLIWRRTSFGKINKTSNALRWAIIGTGYMSELFAQTLNDSHDNILYGVLSRSYDKAKAFAVRHGASKAFDSFDDMLRCRKIDVVYIATPVECHFEQVKNCLEEGKNVLCEKPLVFTSDEAEELFILAKERKSFLMEGMWTLCLPTIHAAKHWISEGRIGKVRFVRADLNKRVGLKHILKHHGVLYDYGIYGVAFISSFMGEGAKLSSAASSKTEDNIITDISAVFETEQCKGVLNLASNLNAQSKAVIIGTKGSIEWETPFNRTETINLFDTMGHRVDNFTSHYRNEGFEYELAEVFNSIKSKKIESECVPIIETQKVLHMISELINGR